MSLLARRAALALAALLPAAALAGVRPAYGGSVRIALLAEPREPDPARATAPADLFLVRALHASLLEVDAAGALRPGLLAEVPAPEAGGRSFRLRLRPGLRASSGAEIGAPDVAAALARLLSREQPSPHAWVALPILGADAFVEGRAATLAGVQVLSERELLVTLAFPLPEFPWLLATPAASVRDTGPFSAGVRRSPGDPLTLSRNELHHAGRPFADALVLRAADARGAARLVERGEVDLVLRPDAAGGTALPPLLATVAAVNGRRLGPAADRVRRALDGLDRADLARRFVRGPSVPLATVVPPAILPGTPAAPASGDSPTSSSAPSPAPAAPRLALLVRADSSEQRAVADRIQVKLFDAGLRVAVEPADGAALAARLQSGDYDVALVPVPILAVRPALAAGEIAFATRGAAAARRAMAALSGLEGDGAVAAAAALGKELDLVPLLASGLRAAAAPALEGLEPRADGALDAGALWLLRGGAR